MNLTGKVKSVQADWMTGKWNVTFEVNEKPSEEMNFINSCEKLNIEVKKFRNKRSLDANALMWVCLQKMAEVLQSDKWSVYLQMLKRYGQFTYICVKPNVVESVKEQWRECEEIGEVDINGQKAVQLLCYFGSSTYNSKEFTVLLDGIKTEMTEIGLQPPSSAEMERAIEQWERVRNGTMERH